MERVLAVLLFRCVPNSPLLSAGNEPPERERSIRGRPWNLSGLHSAQSSAGPCHRNHPSEEFPASSSVAWICFHAETLQCAHVAVGRQYPPGTTGMPWEEGGTAITTRTKQSGLLHCKITISETRLRHGWVLQCRWEPNPVLTISPNRATTLLCPTVVWLKKTVVSQNHEAGGGGGGNSVVNGSPRFFTVWLGHEMAPDPH